MCLVYTKSNPSSRRAIFAARTVVSHVELILDNFQLTCVDPFRLSSFVSKLCCFLCVLFLHFPATSPLLMLFKSQEIKGLALMLFLFCLTGAMGSSIWQSTHDTFRNEVSGQADF